MEREGVYVQKSTSGAAQATALVLGWEGAKMSSLMSCARLYKDLGFHIITASVRHLATFNCLPLSRLLPLGLALDEFQPKLSLFMYG